jgi:hypothetical protein
MREILRRVKESKMFTLLSVMALQIANLALPNSSTMHVKRVYHKQLLFTNERLNFYFIFYLFGCHVLINIACDFSIMSCGSLGVPVQLLWVF